MAIALTQIGNSTNIPVYHWVCDTTADLANIDTSHAPMGSTCYVIDESKEYVLNSSKEWKERTIATTTGGEG